MKGRFYGYGFFPPKMLLLVFHLLSSFSLLMLLDPMLLMEVFGFSNGDGDEEEDDNEIGYNGIAGVGMGSREQ